MQYITQLALVSSQRRTTTARALANKNNFTFYPGLLKSERVAGGSGWIRTIDPRLIKTVL
jgi:hypothetical protein